MKNMLASENLKYRRTFARKLLLIAPLFFVFLAVFELLFIPDAYSHSWELILAQVFNWWPVLFLPMGIALFAVLVENQEKRAGWYQGLRCKPVPPLALWLSKIAIMAYHTLLSTLLLALAVIICGQLKDAGSAPWLQIGAGAAILWFTSLPLIPLQLWTAHHLGTLAGMLVGVAGFLVGVLSASRDFWYAIPWSWPIRLMSPLVGVHPNGTLLEQHDRLLEHGVIPSGLALALGAFLVLSLFTAQHFAKREVPS